MGGAALEANTTGSYNTAFGYAALRITLQQVTTQQLVLLLYK
jgi:hypothetical protein